MKTTTLDNILIINNEASQSLAQKVANEMQIPLVDIKKKKFSDGEIYHVMPLEITGKDVIIIGATHNDSSQQELIDLIDGCHYWRADSINVVIPYLGYSTMERAKPDSGEIPKGITRTRQIYDAHPDYVAFIDLHSEAVMHAHHSRTRTKHMQTDSLAVEKIKQIMTDDSYVLVSPDYGRSKWVAKLASMVGLPHTAADKDRFATDKTMVSQVSSVVGGKKAIILDDMIRTGGSIAQTAVRCRQAGATETTIMATHLVLSGTAREKFAANDIKKVIGSDTYPGIESDDLVDLYSVAPLIAKELKNDLKIS